MAKDEQEVEVKDEGEKEVSDKGDGLDAFQSALNAEDFDPDALMKAVGVEKGEGEEEEKGEEKKETPKPPAPDLQSELARLKQDKINLQKALHEERQSKKVAKKEGEEIALNDAEIVNILKEHKDDPAVLVNTVKYLVAQATKKGKVEAVDAVEVKNKSAELDRVLQERYQDHYHNDGSEVWQYISKVKDHYGLGDHPYGEGLAAALAVFMNLPALQKQYYEQGVKDQLDGKVEKVRQENLRGGKITGSGKKLSETIKTPKSVDLTEDQMETAQKLGFAKDPKKLQLYKTQILKRQLNA